MIARGLERLLSALFTAFGPEMAVIIICTVSVRASSGAPPPLLHYPSPYPPPLSAITPAPDASSRKHDKERAQNDGTYL
jgi:hypothetical protein